MAISYHYDDKTKVTTGLLLNCENDFLRPIKKIMQKHSKYLTINEKVHKDCIDLKMNHAYLSRIDLHDGDVDDSEVAYKYSKEKTLKNYYKAFDRRIIAFLRDIVNLENAIRAYAEHCHVELPEDLKK